jgi:hypothetical protein
LHGSGQGHIIILAPQQGVGATVQEYAGEHWIPSFDSSPQASLSIVADRPFWPEVNIKAVA